LSLRLKTVQIGGIIVLGAIVLALIPWAINHNRKNYTQLQASEARPLGQCEGPCSDDGDCQQGLYCYHTHPSVTFISSKQCDDNAGIEGEFFCYQPSADELVLRGSDRNPESSLDNNNSSVSLATAQTPIEEKNLTLVDEDNNEIKFPLAMCQGGMLLIFV
jgi:hypothetical protein